MKISIPQPVEVDYVEGCKTAMAQVIEHANYAISALRSKRDRVFFGAKYDKAISRINDIKYSVMMNINPDSVTSEYLAIIATCKMQSAIDRINEIFTGLYYGV